MALTTVNLRATHDVSRTWAARSDEYGDTDAADADVPTKIIEDVHEDGDCRSGRGRPNPRWLANVP